MEQIKIGIIGIGNMGSTYCKFLSDGMVPEIKLVAVADRRESRRKWLAENFPDGISVFTEGTELIDSSLCDAVIITVPHYQHPQLSIYAMEHNLHVLCDKPAGVYTKQVRAMNDVAQKSNVVFAMMFNQRTNCIYRKLHEIIESKELGPIKRVNWIVTDWYRTQAYYDSGSWRATWSGEGGGVLLNQCPHQLDLFQWLFGLPTKVRAFCHEGKWHNIEVEDDVTAYMEFENGATGVFVTSTADAPGTNRLEITFDRGKILCEDDKLTLWQLETSESQFRFQAKNGFDHPAYHVLEVATDGLNEQHIGVIKAFAGKILHGTPLIAEGIEGIRGLTLSNAMHLSSWLNQTVSIPFDEDLFYQKLQDKCKTSTVKQESDIVFDTNGSY